MNKILSDKELQQLLTGTGITLPISPRASATVKALIGLHIVIAISMCGIFLRIH